MEEISVNLCHLICFIKIYSLHLTGISANFCQHEWNRDMGEENNVQKKPDGFKWLVIASNGKTDAKIFSDLRGASRYMQISESTLYRKIKVNGTTFKHEGYIISKCPYYVSKRGR